MNLDNSWVIKGDKNGPVIAIFGGVHGDEHAGIEAIEYLRENLKINHGTVHLVLANPAAIAKGQRMLGKNLNRCLFKGNRDKDSVDVRARQLMRLLDQCDGLLDLHEHKEDELGDFIVCEKPSFKIAKSIGAPLITYNWVDAEPGATDSYMYNQGKVGICYELGSNTKTVQNIQLALAVVNRFLGAFNVIDLESRPAVKQPSFVKILRAIHKYSESFHFTGSFRSFALLPPGKVFAVDGTIKYAAGVDEVIIFPRPQNNIGTEACLIGQFTAEPGTRQARNMPSSDQSTLIRLSKN